MTYSIVARCPRTGQLGVAVQSAIFGAGRIVAWAEAGVGAVATQAMAEVAHGPEILDRLRDGMTASDALAAAVAGDPGAATRQLGVVDALGNVASHTGDRTIAHAGDVVVAGANVAAQANMMANAGVAEAMVAAFADAGEGEALAHRLVAALQAAQDAGGDFRGVQAGAVRVVESERQRAGHGVVVDVRAEDSDDPVGELRRLVGLAEAYAVMDASEQALEAGDLPTALRLAAEAAELLPHVVDSVAFHVLLLLASGATEDARRVAHAQPRREALDVYLRRVIEAGLVRLDASVVDALWSPRSG